MMGTESQLEKSLIVCYSYSGNTWNVAREIRRQIGAPLCEVYPRQPYPMLFETLLVQVRRELGTGFLPSIFPISEDVNNYDVIYVGTPNWCGTVAPPIASFLKKYDLEGKTIRPFYTHCGGGSGNVEQDMRKMCQGANVCKGISLTNDGGSALAAKIFSWLLIEE